MNSKLWNFTRQGVNYDMQDSNLHDILENDPVCHINMIGYATLQEAFAEANGNDIIKILKDCTVSNTCSLSDGRHITLDLGGHVITLTSGTYIQVVKGELTIDNGYVRANNIDGYAFRTIACVDAIANNAILTLGRNLTVENMGGYGAMISFRPTSADPIGHNGAVLNIGGKIVSAYGIYVNGTISNPTTGCECSVNISAGANIQGGLYGAGYAKYNISSGAILEADTESAVEIRAGIANIGAARLISYGIPTTVISNGNGSTSTGAALAIAQHTTKKPIDVTLTDTILKGFTGLYQSNPENNENINEQVSIKFNSGKAIAELGGTVAIYCENPSTLTLNDAVQLHGSKVLNA